MRTGGGKTGSSGNKTEAQEKRKAEARVWKPRERSEEEGQKVKQDGVTKSRKREPGLIRETRGPKMVPRKVIVTTAK